MTPQAALDMDFPRITPWVPKPGSDAYTAILMMLAGGVEADTFYDATKSHSLPQVVGYLADRGWPLVAYDVPRPLPGKPYRRLALYLIDLDKINLPAELLGKVGAAQ